MYKTPTIWQLTQKVTLLYLPFFVVGYFSDLVPEISLLFCALVIAFNYHYLMVLTNWLWNKKGIYPPKAKGAWEDVFDGIYQQQRRNAKKRAELSRLVRRFRLGAEALPDGVVIFDHQRHIIWCNSLSQQMLGLIWPDDRGNRIDNLVRLPEFVDYLDDMQYEQPFDLPSPEVEGAILECRLVPFEEDKWTLLVRDVTQLKQLEQMRKDFIANVSHELKTPLTVMRGYLEMIPDKSSVPDSMWQQAHKMMLEQTTRMDDLVAQLLSLSKLENQDKEIHQEEVDVPDMLGVLLQEAVSLSDGQHEISLKAEPNTRLMGVGSELRSAFSNLVFNAIRYTQEGGKIDIVWELMPSGSVRFSVTDNGVGIASEHITRLTERFYRVDEARTRQTGGAGLGLSIVKHALANHQSKLEISSQTGEGSCFSFSFPKHLIALNKH